MCVTLCVHGNKGTCHLPSEGLWCVLIGSGQQLSSMAQRNKIPQVWIHKKLVNFVNSALDFVVSWDSLTAEEIQKINSFIC